ncbi:MAG: HEAT repeat domain-containing protein [Acidimicrobiia bacterium]|nr:HEAT repeat domain-containing protein [Acidimicrobiia bacterium]
MNPADYAALVRDPLPFVSHDDPEIRWLAISSCHGRMDDPAVVDGVEQALRSDTVARVRAEAAEALGSIPERFASLLAATTDEAAIVREAVATAFGELADPEAVPWLIDAAAGDDDKLVREAAIAALGAIGDPTALPTLLEIVTSAGPQLRRRTVVALSVFDGPDVESALRAAAHDRNPMVREAAEMVVGRPATWEPVELKLPEQ